MQDEDETYKNAFTIDTRTPTAYGKTILNNLYYKYNLFPLTCYDTGTDVQVTWEAPPEPQLLIQILKLNKLMQQCESIMNMAEVKNYYLLGRAAHLNIERILVISKVRLDTLADTTVDNFLCIPLQKSAPTKVTIEHMHWPQSAVPYIVYRQYFCVLYHGTTVYGTNISSMIGDAYMSFAGPYKFENLPPNFVIRAKFYSANFDAFLTKRDQDIKLPMMELRAEAVITADSFRRQKCIFINPTDMLLPAYFLINGKVEIKTAQTSAV